MRFLISATLLLLTIFGSEEDYRFLTEQVDLIVENSLRQKFDERNEDILKEDNKSTIGDSFFKKEDGSSKSGKSSLSIEDDDTHSLISNISTYETSDKSNAEETEIKRRHELENSKLLSAHRAHKDLFKTETEILRSDNQKELEKFRKKNDELLDLLMTQTELLDEKDKQKEIKDLANKNYIKINMKNASQEKKKESTNPFKVNTTQGFFTDIKPIKEYGMTEKRRQQVRKTVKEQLKKKFFKSGEDLKNLINEKATEAKLIDTLNAKKKEENKSNRLIKYLKTQKL